MNGSFGLLSEDDDIAHYGDELRDRRDSETGADRGEVR